MKPVRAAPRMALALAVSGCAPVLSRPITIAQALGELQRQLRAAGAVSPTGNDEARLAATALRAQCEAGAADPEMPLLRHELTITLTGSFSATGGFSVGNQVLGSGLSGTATRGQTQTLDIPLTFVSLTDVPDTVVNEQLASLADVPAPIRGPAIARAFAARDLLAARIAAIVDHWSPALCTRDGGVRR